jgi:hypothetical protein
LVELADEREQVREIEIEQVGHEATRPYVCRRYVPERNIATGVFRRIRRSVAK